MIHRSQRRLAVCCNHVAPCGAGALRGQGVSASGGVALIVGGGPGLSAACARLFSKENFRVAIASRNPEKADQQKLARDFGVRSYSCDVADASAVRLLFEAVTRDLGGFPELVVFNASAAARGPIQDIDAAKVKDGLLVTAYGGFNVAQQAALGMVPRGSGSILFTGASASYKGYANSSSFAMGKFGLRGLAESLARELAPKGIHVAHFPIDGGIGRVDDNGEKTSHWARYQAVSADGAARAETKRVGTNGDVIDDGDTMLHPDAIAQTYLFAHRQHRSAWTFDFQLRPWGERW